MAMTKLQQMSLDLYNGKKIEFDGVSGDQALRNALLDAVGGEWSRKNYEKNKWDFFEVMSEVLTFPMEQTLEGMFDGILTTETLGYDEHKVIELDKPELYKVSVVASGNNDIRRQRDFSDKINVETSAIGIKLYEDFRKFIAGKIDWVKMVNKAKASMTAKIAEMIYECLSASFDAGERPELNKTGVVKEADLNKMIALVEAKTGMKCAIYGGKTALSKISNSVVNTTVGVADSQKEQYANLGYFQHFGTTPMVELPTIFKGNQERFANEFYVLPQMNDIIRVFFRGEALVEESQDSQKRADQQIEFLMTQEVGIVCLVTGYFGMWRAI